MHKSLKKNKSHLNIKPNYYLYYPIKKEKSLINKTEINQIPTIIDSYNPKIINKSPNIAIKNRSINPNNLNAYKNADINSNKNDSIKAGKIKNLIQNDKNIKKFLQNKKNEKKEDIERKKKELKQEITKTIKNTLNLVKNTYNKNALIQKNKDINLLLSLGIDLNSLIKGKIIIDIEKAWNYCIKLFKGKINKELLNLNIVNAIMYLSTKNNKKSKSVNLSNIEFKKVRITKLNENKENKLGANRVKMIDSMYGNQNNNFTLSTTADGNKTKMDYSIIKAHEKINNYSIYKDGNSSTILCRKLPCKTENDLLERLLQCNKIICK